MSTPERARCRAGDRTLGGPVVAIVDDAQRMRRRVTSAYVARSGVASREFVKTRALVAATTTTTTTNIVRNVVVVGGDRRRPSRRDTAAAEKLTGIESQSKVIIQIRDGRGAQETAWRRRGRGEWSVQWAGELQSD